MSSSTITAKPYLTESWIHQHMQRHDQFSNSEKENKYARSTASSRSRCSATSSMIAESIADGRRRRSAANILSEHSSKIHSSSNTATNTTTNLPKLQQLQSKRRQSQSGALSGNDSSSHNINRDNKQPTITALAAGAGSDDGSRGPGLIKLADTLRQTLALERKLAKEELEKATKNKTGTALTTNKYTRRRTLSTTNVARLPGNDNGQNSGSYLKPTLADHQRRNSMRLSSPSHTSALAAAAARRKSVAHISSSTTNKNAENDSVSLALRRRSILAAATAKARQQNLLSPTTLAANNSNADDESSLASSDNKGPPQNKISPSRRTRKKSILNEVNAGRRMSRTESLKEGLPTINTTTTTTTATANSTTTNSILKSARLSSRKSSITSSPTKRNSSITTTKSNNIADGITTISDIKTASEQKQRGTITNAVGSRKRGKTLPGNLAKPPPVQALKLPPMKVEPIKVDMPLVKKRTSVAMKAKTPTAVSRIAVQKKRMSLSESTTPVSVCPLSSSTSSSPNTATITSTSSKAKRRSKGLSLIDTRRASFKSLSSLNYTPPHTATAALIPVSNVKPSPRIRPTSTTRRPSLGLTIENQSRVKNAEKSQQKEQSYSPSYCNNNSTAFYNSISSGSRKNSLVVDEVAIAENNNNTSNKIRRSTAAAVSLREKLEAMVAEHAIQEDNIVTNNRSNKSPYSAAIIGMKKQSKDLSKMLDSTNMTNTLQSVRNTSKMNDLISTGMLPSSIQNLPMTPSIAIKLYGHQLSPYEQAEIQGYPEIYFVGRSSIEKYQAMPDSYHHQQNSKQNYGYDDERGDYKILLHDHLAYRYEVLEELGRGSFGQVVKCFDHKLGITVAIKLIRNKKRFYAQAKTEVRILSDLTRWDPEDRHHNVKMTEYFNFRNHLCIACECLSMNLYEFIKINNFQGFQTKLIKRFTIQILRSLSLLKKHGVIHCDLKPENILLKHPTKSTIKVIDFGSSCLTHQRVYTYIQSRFYRSPEIILGLDYGTSIDMWSLGCIIAELYTGVPLFPGENEQEQLACIMEVLGVPDSKYINMSERRSLFFDRHGEPRAFYNSRGKKRKAGSKSLPQVLRCNDPLFLDFIQQCLVWDPLKRLTPDKAFQHAWIVQQQQQLPLPSSSTNRYSPSHQAEVHAGSEPTSNVVTEKSSITT